MEQYKFHSFSWPKFLMAGILFSLGFWNIYAFDEADLIYFITIFPYFYFTGYGVMFFAFVLLIYQFWSWRKFTIERTDENITIHEKPFWKLHATQYTFSISDIVSMRLGNRPPLGEFTLFITMWYFIWFFIREGFISLRDYSFLGYWRLLNTGVTLLITYIGSIALFLIWIMKYPRFQLRIENSTTFVHCNFNRFSIDDCDAILKIFGMAPIDTNKIDSISQKKWKMIYLLIGFIFTFLGFILLLVDIYYYFSLSRFTDMLLIILGLYYMNYGYNLHYFRISYSNLKNNSKKEAEFQTQSWQYSKRALNGYEFGIVQHIQNQKIRLSVKEKSHYKIIMPFEAFALFLIVYNLILQIFKFSMNVYDGSIERLYFSIIWYICLGIFLLGLIGVIYFVPNHQRSADLPSEIKDVYNNSRFPLKAEFIVRTLICIVLMIIIFALISLKILF